MTKWGSRYKLLFPTRGALALALFVCVAAPITLVALQINSHPKFSPIDEGAHFDYVDRVAQGEIPRQGEHLLDSTLRELACRGTALEGLKVPPCDTEKLARKKFPGGAYQYEAQQPPTYYAAAVPLRWINENVFQVDNKLDATRAANLFWIVGGLLLAWAAGRLMGIDPLPLGAGLLLIAAAPIVVYGTATVSNDITAVPAAGLVAFVAALTYTRPRPRMWVFVGLTGVFVVALKTTNLFPVVAVSALFAVWAITRRDDGERWSVTLRRWLPDGGVLLAGGIVSAGIWATIHRSLALIDLQKEPTFNILRGGSLTPGLLLREAATLLEPLTGSFVSPQTLGHDVQAPLYAMLGFLIIAGSAAGLFVTPRRWSHTLGLIAVPTLYVGGVVFGAGLVINYKIDPGLSGRYGLSMAPLLALVLAANLVGRWSVRAVAAFASALFATTLVIFLT